MTKATTSILWYNSSTGETQIWFMDGIRLSGRATVLGEDGSPILIGPPWSIVGLISYYSSFDKPYIIWHNSSTHETKAWGMFNHNVNQQATVLGEDGNPIFIEPPWLIVGTTIAKPGILWHNSSTNETQLWFMGGLSVSSRATVLGEDGTPTYIEPPWGIVGTGNFKDDKDDIVWYNSSTGETQIWFMDDARLSGRATVIGEDGNPIFIGPPWGIVGTGDFNRDGKDDIVWYNSSTGETQIWFMDGAKLSGRATVLGEDGNPIFIGPPWSIVGVDVFTQGRIPPRPGEPR